MIDGFDVGVLQCKCKMKGTVPPLAGQHTNLSCKNFSQSKSPAHFESISRDSERGSGRGHPACTSFLTETSAFSQLAAVGLSVKTTVGVPS